MSADTSTAASEVPKVLAFAEMRAGGLAGVAREAVATAARLAGELGGRTEALVLAEPGIAHEAAATLGEVGADSVTLLEDTSFASYAPEQWAHATYGAIRESDASVVTFSATAVGRDLAPRVAAMLDVPLAPDVTRLETRNGTVVATRPVYSGKALADLRMDASPAVVSIRPNVFPAGGQARAAGAVAPVAVRVPELPTPRVRSVERRAEAGELEVTEASTIVSGGRGMKGPENWGLLETLRDALGPATALGASRAVVDAGWRPHSEQVGQTGKTVSPKLYFAVGISGAIQHLAGMRSSGTIVAINRDRDAPIFSVADYGIVGDALEILPALAERVAHLRASD